MKKANKVFRVFWALGIAVVLAGCGEAAPAGNLQQDISADFSGGQSNAGKDNKGNDVNQGSAEPNQGGQKEEKGAFGFKYEGVMLIPGEVFDESLLGDYSQVIEIPSCAFDENDKEYSYEKFVLTAYIDGAEERIYSILFTDPNLSTTEGLSMGDSVDDMKALYGENYENVGTSYDYVRGNTVLSIIVQNDQVGSIEYRLNR